MKQLKTYTHHPIVLLKAYYCLYFAAAAALLPFLTLYYERLGLSGSQIGLLAAMLPLVMLLASSLWGGLADATQQHHRLLGLAIGGAIIGALAILWFNSFVGMLAAVVGFAFFSAPIIPLVDNSAMAALGTHKDQYGRLRLWGGVGWGIAAPTIGYLVDRFSMNWTFYGYSGVMLVGLIVAARLPVSQRSIGRYFWQGFRELMGRRTWLFFLTVVFFSGVGQSVIHNYLFLYLDHLQAKATTMGLALTIGTLSELVIFFFSDRLLRRWGIANLLGVAYVAMVGRLLLYSLIETPWLVLPVQLLHGITFAAGWAAGVSYANKIAPDGMGATAQGILAGVAFGLASAVGAFVGGALLEQVGPLLMFRWVALGLLLALLLLALAAKFWANIPLSFSPKS